MFVSIGLSAIAAGAIILFAQRPAVEQAGATEATAAMPEVARP
jgi:AAHS family 4-hydroxybenzoate transporter-like MFS transporter